MEERPTVDREWLEGYFERYRKALFETAVTDPILELKRRLETMSERGGKMIVAGNGGSAAIASHASVDFTKNAGIRTVSVDGAAMVSCLANDYGYEEWVARALEFFTDPDDIVVLISSSGSSANMVRAGETARALGVELVTFTGFEADNPLRQLGDLDFWVDSRAYNIVEMTHQVWLLAVCDAIIGSAEYTVS
jgi:D-sedoheptulose 7-phosphate isomerase